MLTYEKIAAVVESLYKGSTLHAAFKLNDVEPRSFYRAMEKDPKLQRTVDIASRCCGEMLAAEIIEISDTATESTINTAKLKVDSRKWLAAKLNRKYSEHIDVNVAGSIDLNAALIDAKKRLDNVLESDDYSIE